MFNQHDLCDKEVCEPDMLNEATWGRDRGRGQNLEVEAKAEAKFQTLKPNQGAYSFGKMKFPQVFQVFQTL